MTVKDYSDLLAKLIGDFDARAVRWGEESDKPNSDYRLGSANGKAFAYSDVVWTMRNELALAAERAKEQP